MEPVTTYIVKHKDQDIVWEFKYDLKGNLKSFKVEDRPLSGSQIKFLINDNKFPVLESIMKDVWMKAKKSVFEIIIGRPDLSFDTFWDLYDYKVKKVVSERSWKRLGKKAQLDAIAYIPTYKNYLKRKHIQQAAASTYLNQSYWLDNHASIH